MATVRITQFLLQRYLLRYPLQQRLPRYEALAQWQWLQPSLEQIKPIVLPDEVSDRPSSLATPLSNSITLPGLEPFPSHYQQYRCVAGTPLNCAEALRASKADPTAVGCPRCGFSVPLVEQSTLGGQQGHYRVGRCLGQRGIARVYEAIQVGLELPVTLREYVLPAKYFNLRERQQRQEAFLNLTGLALADGRYQDLRVMVPIEAIALSGDERAYLILPAEDQASSLNDLLNRRPAFTSIEVHQVLRQVLQTLVCLHQQKFILSPGRIQTGVVHGNIQLSSLLWVSQGNQWFIYLTDLAMWEEPFNPSVMDAPHHTPSEDLVALGYVAFYLLAGTLTDENGQRLNPKLAHHWPLVYPPLKHFILRLLGVEMPFGHAEAAHQTLLQLPPEPHVNQLAPAAVVEPQPKRRWQRYVIPLLLWLAVLGLAGGLLWFLLRPRSPEAEVTLPDCCFEAVDAVPKGSFNYTAIANDVWEQLLALKPTGDDSLNVAQQLAADQPQLQLNYQSSNSVDEAIAKLRNRQADFAVLPLLKPLPIDMASEVVALDGLAVVVAFNYQGRSQGLPDALSGAIALDTVKKLYEGRVDNWQEVQSSIRLRPQLYLNQNPTVQVAFKHLVLQDEEAIAASITNLDTIPLLRAIIRDFEQENIGSIGITSLSSIEGQCSVYPLAIQLAGQAPVQPFRLANGDVIQPGVDLCRRKGTYRIDAELLRSQSYPLAYPLAVVYRRDNRLPPIGVKFAQLLLTDEGQNYLQQLDLTPVTAPAK